MRTLALIPLAVFTTACWTLGPEQTDPTRYPWQSPRAATGTFCVRALGPPSGTGITPGKPNALTIGCSPAKGAFGRRPKLPPLPYCVGVSVPRRGPAPCVTPGPGADSALGPAWVYRQIGPQTTIRIKLRDLTPREKAELKAKRARPSPI